jgi:sugar phosphate isomerase/epimerase
MCLDIGHANLCASTRNDYLGYLDRLDLRVPIIHLHVHENWGDCDSHLPLFTGPAGRDGAGVRGFIERIKRRNYSGSIILEQWPHPPSLLNQAREGLKQLLAEERWKLPHQQ